ncbi:MAG: hypothetical protein WA966_02900 [Ornithinimicrobium sp.]
MHQRTLVAPVTLDVNTMPRQHLLQSLQKSGVRLNEAAATLMDNAIFDNPMPERVTVHERSVSDLGMTSGRAASADH